jgi:hypothetical protein
MNMDGIQRGLPNTTGFGGTDNVGTTSAAQGAQPAGEATDATQLLDAARLLGSQSKSATDALPPPPEKVDNAKALAGLTSLGDTQVNADIYAFMALFQKLAQQMRDTARTQRTSEMQSQVSALQNAAEKMKDAAAQRLTAAIVQGVAQIAGGLMQMGMSTLSARDTIKGARMEADGNKNLAQIEQLSTKGQLNIDGKTMLTQGALDQVASGKALGAQGGLYQALGQGSSGVTAGLGGIIGAHFTNKADQADADKMNLETQAKIHETGVQHANDMMQQMMDVIRDVRDKLQSIQQASVETSRGIARNI